MSVVITTYKVARCYAQALAQVLGERDLLAQALGPSKELFDALVAPEVYDLWVSPRKSLAQKKKLLREMVEEVLEEPVAGVLASFFQVLLEAERMEVLPEIYTRLLQLKDERNGVQRGELVLAEEASSSQLKEIQHVVSEVFGGDVRLRVGVDPGLWAGFVVKVGFLRYDGSLKGHLKELQWFLRS